MNSDRTIRRASILLLLGCVFLHSLLAQIPVGTFRAHLSYYGTHSIAVTPDAIYAAGENGLLYVNKDDQSLGTWSKVEGLSETEISSIYYEPNTGYLVVAYASTNLDFIKDGRLTNLPDIKNKTMTGEKKINHIDYDNGLLYISCSFGIVSINPETLLVQDTWYSQVGNQHYSINSLQVFRHHFFALTNQGVFSAPVDSYLLPDFATWQKIDTLGSDPFRCGCLFQDRLYVTKHLGEDTDSLLYFDGTQWHSSNIELSPIRALCASDTELMVSSWNYVVTFDANEVLKSYISTLDSYSWGNIQDAAFDGKLIWIADKNNGLVRYDREWGRISLQIPNGPFSSFSYKMDYQDGTIAMVPGAITPTGASSWLGPDFSYFRDEHWTNLLQRDNSELRDSYDLTAVAINPRNTDEFYVGSFYTGLIKYGKEGVLETYSRSNSPIQSGDTAEGRIGGLRFDAYGNLWASCSYSSYPLVVKKTDGTWQGFHLSSYVSGYSTLLTDIMIDSRGYKWILKPRENTIIVFNDNGTISNLSDDQTTTLNMNAAANIETSTVNCVVEDKNGQIWIGCNLGIKVIYNPGKVFEGTAYPQNVLIEQINHVQNLFEFEEVTCIAVDDANRKWVGTAKSGVFLISENGKDQLLHFTEEDSPLLSNKIFNICINRESGEVFFATSKGLISYRGTATEGKEDYSEVKVFPNPVRESYHGPITVSGLMENAFCKVADAAGNLVWQDYANGGTFTWNGKDFYGNRPATGVYFVFSSDKSGKQKNVAKILFVK